MYLEDGKRVPETLETIAEKRQWLLERVELYETQLVEFVRAEYLKGSSARNIAKRAGLTHPTVLKWINRASTSQRNVTPGDGN
jgi:DNA-directed RNA polymerase specialized sigma24 family protein